MATETCTNCSGTLATTHSVSDKSGKRRFCDTCAAIGEALNIGNPATPVVILYDDNHGGAVTWTSGVPPLGTIVHRQEPPRHRFAPIRYRVRMLDGSMWHGYGPSSHGTYIRLYRMKGA